MARDARRAAGNVRRLVCHGRCSFLWTLTYKSARTSREEVVRDLRRFFEDIQAKYGRLRILAVVERGRKHGRLHAHFAVDKWLAHSIVKTSWGRGHVFVGDPGKLPGNPGARLLSGYLAKYVVKQLEDDDRAPGGHRYQVTQGWQPPCWRRRFSSDGLAAEWQRRVMGEPVDGGTFDFRPDCPAFGWWLRFGDDQLWAPWDAFD